MAFLWSLAEFLWCSAVYFRERVIFGRGNILRIYNTYLLLHIIQNKLMNKCKYSILWNMVVHVCNFQACCTLFHDDLWESLCHLWCMFSSLCGLCTVFRSAWKISLEVWAHESLMTLGSSDEKSSCGEKVFFFFSFSLEICLVQIGRDQRPIVKIAKIKVGKLATRRTPVSIIWDRKKISIYFAIRVT